MKNKFLLTGILVLGVSCLSGCSMVADVTYDFTTPGSVNVTEKVSLDKASVDALNDSGESPKDMVVETINGVEYYSQTETRNVAGNDALSGSDEELTGKVTKDIVYVEAVTDDSTSSAYGDVDTSDISLLYTMTVNNDVPYVETSGVLSNDNKTTTFTLDNASAASSVKWYAYTEKGKQLIAANKVVPTVYLGKCSKWNNKAPMFEIGDDFWGTASVKANGKQLYKKYSVSAKTAKVIGTKTKTNPSMLSDWKASGNSKNGAWLKEGKNNIVVSNPQGLTTSFTYNYDSKNPVVNTKKKTFKNKAVITVSDKTSGINKVTYNGKKVAIKKIKKNTYKVTISKKGKGTVKVYDKAGNVTTAKITIK